MTLTFYSGKLWHSDKPFPKACSYESKISCGSAECIYEGCGFIRSWLSTAYEVVNPEKLEFDSSILALSTRGRYGRMVEAGNPKGFIAYEGGDQIPLPEGLTVEKVARLIKEPVNTEGAEPGKICKNLDDCDIDKGICDWPKCVVSEPSESQERFIVPDNGEHCWTSGAESFTRQEVFNLLWTQRAMISNDLKRVCGNDLPSDAFDILKNPRVPKF